MALAKLATLVSTFPGPGLPPEWVSAGSPASVSGNAVQIPAATDFKTNISTVAFYDPLSSSLYGKLLFSTPRSYTTTPAPPAFVPYNRISIEQPGGTQCKVLNGYYPGFTVGQQATGQMKPTIDKLEVLLGDHIEAVGVGLPNQMGDCSSSLAALQGETRFVVFAMPMVPHATHSGDTVGSITDLLAGVYDSKIIDMVTKMVAAGFGGVNVSSRIGWEFNDTPSSVSGFEWSVNHIDPRTGLANGITKVHQAQAYFENILRTHGYTGYIEWCGGNHDSGALPIATAMPTHATTWKSKTLWGWDLYAPVPYNAGKDNLTAIINYVNPTYDSYLTWCRANGYKMCHGEWGVTYAADSPYSPQGSVATGYIAWFYRKLADNGKDVAYAMFYGQNQPYTPGLVLTESHQIAFCGGAQGVPSITVGTGPNPIGSSNPNTKGSTPTASTMGTLHNVADTGNWTLTTDPNKAPARDAWLANFAGATTGKGTAGLGVPYVAPASPVTAGPKAQVILTPGGSHNPVVQMLLEFDYDKTQSSLTVNFVDDGTGVNTAAVAATNIWFRMRDDGANVHWETSADTVTWTNLRTAARPAWWNSTDGVKVTIASHNDDGTQTITPLIVSNINTTAGAVVSTGPDPAIFDKFNIAAGVPGPVLGLNVRVTGNAVALNWGAPLSGVVAGYIVSATPLNDSSPTVASQTTTVAAATFLGLAVGSSYVFTVQAYNSAGANAGISTGAVTISGTPVTGPAPTPAAVTGLANSLPITPLPAAYYPLLLSTDADDGDSLANAALQRMADLFANGYRPYLGNPEVAAVAVVSYVAADLRVLMRAIGASMFAAFGQQVLQNPQRVDVPSQVVTTWTASDTNGHVIPAGTQVSYPAAGTQPLTFTTRGDIDIPNGTASVTDIVLISDQTGSYTNQVPVGDLELQANILWLESVTVTTPATGGQDAELDQDYLNRLVDLTRTLGQTLILPADYARYAQAASPAVYRAYAVPNFDANNPSTSLADRTVSVYMLGADGLPVQPDVAADVEAQLRQLREVNFTVVCRDGGGNAIAPSYVNVNVTATVVCRTGYAQVDVQSAVTTALGSFLNPAYWEGGYVSPPLWTGRTIVRPHDLAAVIGQVPGVDHIDSLAISGGAVKVTGTDNYTLTTSSNRTAVLPAGTAPGSHWTTPSVITVTANPPAIL